MRSRQSESVVDLWPGTDQLQVVRRPLSWNQTNIISHSHFSHKSEDKKQKKKQKNKSKKKREKERDRERENREERLTAGEKQSQEEQKRIKS